MAGEEKNSNKESSTASRPKAAAPQKKLKTTSPIQFFLKRQNSIKPRLKPKQELS